MYLALKVVHTSTSTMWVKLSPPTASETSVMNFVPPSKNLGPPVSYCKQKLHVTNEVWQ